MLVDTETASSSYTFRARRLSSDVFVCAEVISVSAVQGSLDLRTRKFKLKCCCLLHRCIHFSNRSSSVESCVSISGRSTLDMWPVNHKTHTDSLSRSLSLSLAFSFSLSLSLTQHCMHFDCGETRAPAQSVQWFQ